MNTEEGHQAGNRRLSRHKDGNHPWNGREFFASPTQKVKTEKIG
jgi:hypothetical protein